MSIERLIRKYESQFQECRLKKRVLEEKIGYLSIQGYKSLGYYDARVDLCKEVIDDLKYLRRLEEQNDTIRDTTDCETDPV